MFADLDLDMDLPGMQWVIDKPDWESETLEVIATYAPGGTFIDIGAWAGLMSIHASHCGAGAIVAFEPDPRAYEALNRNLMRNIAPGTWVHTHDLAVWGHGAGTELAYHGEPGDSLTGPTRTGTPFPVATCTPGWIAKKHPEASLIKVDTEGSESEFITELLTFYPLTPVVLSVHVPEFMTAGDLNYLDRTATIIDRGDGAHHTVLLTP